MGKKITITIVDDDFDDQQLIEAAIKESVGNCRINSVYTGGQLLSYIGDGTHAPDLIILDINMPGDSGFEALKKLNKKSMVSVPVCVLTTSNSEKDMKLALELGAVAFYTKPSKYNDLVGIIKSVCDDCLGSQN